MTSSTPIARYSLTYSATIRGAPPTDSPRSPQQAEPDPVGQHREGGERRPALEFRVRWVALVGHQVVVDPERVPAGSFNGRAGLAQIGPAGPVEPERGAEAHPHLRRGHGRLSYGRARSYGPDRHHIAGATMNVDWPAVQGAILEWYTRHGRKLPFRGTGDPYAILVSEAMAQQTQAERAGEAWVAFLATFPTLTALAAATPADVLRAWRGLGYNRRALNLWRAARRIVELHGGQVPADLPALQRLPGVGPYTARAVAAIAFGAPVGAVDTNVRRVLGRIVVGRAGFTRTADLQGIADAVVPTEHPAAWTHALMDLGATVCRAREPNCAGCPARPWCRYVTAPQASVPAPLSQGGRDQRASGPSRSKRATATPFEATSRWLRGRIVDRLRASGPGEWQVVEAPIGSHGAIAVAGALDGLARDGLIELDGTGPGRGRRARLALT